MNADKAAGGAAMLTLMAIPSLLICGGLYLGTQALGLSGGRDEDQVKEPPSTLSTRHWLAC